MKYISRTKLFSEMVDPSSVNLSPTKKSKIKPIL